MRFFRHVITEYTCTKHCGCHRSVISPTLSPFNLIAATAAAFPLWLVSLSEPWQFPWYYLFSILAGELLLVFAAGFLSTPFLMPFASAGTTVCQKCRAPMFCAGRHFDPLGSARPHWTDVVLFVVFLALNIVVWLVIYEQDIHS